MIQSSRFSRFIQIFILLALLLLSACTGFKYKLYEMALSHEHRKAGLTVKTLDWNGRSISYLESDADAEKPTIVMIHGFAANKENWVRFAGYLTDSYHVVAIDLPGHGESAKDMTLKYGWEDQAGYVHEILGILNIKKCHLAGNSMGGAISCLYAVTYPDEVESLLLIDPAGIFTYECELTKLLREGKNPLIVNCEADFESLIDFAMEEKPFIPWPITGVLAQKAVENQTINKKMFSDMHGEKPYVFEEEIKKIQTPALIVWGDKDRIISVRNADVFEELIPDSKKVILNNVGHAPMIEVPKKTAGIYLDFLSSL